MFSESLDEQLLLTLPYRQFVFTLPKALRVFLRRDQRLFAQAGTAAAVAYQPFGDSLLFNPHFHALIPEGGFDSAGQFYYLPVHDTPRLAEGLRRCTMGLF